MTWIYAGIATWFGAAIVGGVLILIAERFSRNREPSEADVRRAAFRYRQHSASKPSSLSAITCWLLPSRRTAGTSDFSSKSLPNCWRPASPTRIAAAPSSLEDFSPPAGLANTPDHDSIVQRHPAAGDKTMKKPNARELPLIKRRIAALLDKTEANGCTPGEAAAAFEKAEELIAKYGLDPSLFRWAARPSTAFGSATSAPKPSKPPQAAASSRGRGIGSSPSKRHRSNTAYTCLSTNRQRIIVSNLFALRFVDDISKARHHDSCGARHQQGGRLTRTLVGKV